MLQRKQSLWLFIAALLNSGVFFFDFYRYHTTEAGVEAAHSLRIMNNYPMLLIAVVMTLLPLITIFMFHNRKRQISMCMAIVLAIVCFISLGLGWVTREMNAIKAINPPQDYGYWIGSMLPDAAFIFVIMAIFGIRRDDKLVKSTDRLR